MFLQVVLLITISFIHASNDCIADASNMFKGGHNVTDTIDNQNKFEKLYAQLKEQYEDQLKKLQNKYDILQETLLSYGENVESQLNSNISCHMSDQKFNTCDDLDLKLDEIYRMSNNQTNSLMEKLDMLIKHSAVNQSTTQSPSNQLQKDEHFNKIVRVNRTRGKYVGCYQDHATYRLMRGYVKRMRLNHVELCVNLCRSGNFVYAGLGHEWCFCENTMHDTAYNYKLDETYCSTPCRGNPSQMCGRGFVNSVYETGIEQYLVDEEGQQLAESYLPRSDNNYYVHSESGGFDD